MSKLVNLVMTNDTVDVAEVKKVTIGSARDGDTYGLSFEFSFVSVVASGDTPDTIATALRALVGSSVPEASASGAGDEVILTASRGGQQLPVSGSHPNMATELVTPFALAADVELPPAMGRVVPEGGSLSLILDVANLDQKTVDSLNGLERAGKISILPPLDAVQSGVLSGNLAVATGLTLDVKDMRVTGDLSITGTLNAEGLQVEGDTVMAAGGALTASDSFFEGDLDNSGDVGTVTLSGGRVMGTVSGTVSHDQGAIGV